MPKQGTTYRENAKGPQRVDRHRETSSCASLEGRTAGWTAKLERLTRGTTRESLRSLLGAEFAETTWRDACRRAGVEDSDDLDLEQLMDIADSLSDQSGVVGIVGTSLGIRVKTYAMLARAGRLRQFLGDS